MSAKNTSQRNRRKNTNTTRQPRGEQVNCISNTSEQAPAGSDIRQNANKTGQVNGPSRLSSANNQSIVCVNLEEFSKKAEDLKNDINNALKKQSHSLLPEKPPIEVLQLRESLLKLSTDNAHLGDSRQDVPGGEPTTRESGEIVEGSGQQSNINNMENKKDEEATLVPKSFTSDAQLLHALDQLTQRKSDGGGGDNKSIISEQKNQLKTRHSSGPKKSRSQAGSAKDENDSELKSNQTSLQANDQSKCALLTDFELLDAKLDSESKFVALTSSLQKRFASAPELLEPICRKMVQLSDRNEQLVASCHNYQIENEKSTLIKQKLENLCRELQKSNNSIRIESLDLIKAEQSKAKDQTAKIQSTLSGVIKLFDENQQRNMNLRQENLDLQSKLKSLLEHCDNWEKSVSVSLNQRDIEYRLIKTELAKANLIRNEEREKFLLEKQELLQVLSLMQEQQHRIEGQEAKLRSDLSSYANKYDECQAVISKGMSKFQAESKRMLKQLEQSRQDYMVLLGKYEASNKRTTKLLEEKQSWDRSLGVANRKIETLEKLCRALRANPNDMRASIVHCPPDDAPVEGTSAYKGTLKQQAGSHLNNAANGGENLEQNAKSPADDSRERSLCVELANVNSQTTLTEVEARPELPIVCLPAGQTESSSFAETDHKPAVDKGEVAALINSI